MENSKEGLLRRLDSLKQDAISLWEKMDDRYSKEKIDREIAIVEKTCEKLVEIVEEHENWEEIKIAEYERGLKDAQQNAKPKVNDDRKFINHIQSHLQPGQEVICKICGKTAREIIGVEEVGE